MRWYQKLSGSSNFQAQSAIGRRKVELVHAIGLMAFGNLIVIADLQVASGLPKLMLAGFVLFPFCIAILWALRLNKSGRYLIARWMVTGMFSSAVLIQVLAFHGTDLRTYFYLASTGIAGAVLLPWRHRPATLLFISANFIAFFWLDAVQLPASPEVIAAHDNWAIRTLSVWVRVSPFVSIAAIFMMMEYLTRRTERELDALAVTDVLTGLYNRRGADALLKRELVAASRRRSSLWLALVDIDHFKQVNDRLGHQIGDSTLRQVAQELRDQARGGDFAARWGGEEFLVAMPSCSDAKGAGVAAERMRGAVAARELALADAAPLRVTISIGVASVPPDGDLDAAIARADQALYRAKADGRNRVVVADESKLVQLHDYG